MKNYIINHSAVGCDTVEIDDNRLITEDCNIIIALTSDVGGDDLHAYYNTVLEAIHHNNRVFLLIVGKDSLIRQTIASLMALYRCYDIYKVDSLETVNKDYVDAMLKRTPTILEVQQYIGGDISAYADTSAILIGVKTLALQSDLEGLKKFIEEHLESIEGSVGVVEHLRKIADTTNSGELSEIIDSLKVKIDTTNKELQASKDTVVELKSKNDSLESSVTSTKKELSKALSKAKDLEAQMNAAGSAPVISSYREINTSMIKCKVQHIIYFKEISYVRYVNSLVMNLMQILKVYKLRVKLIIYDSRHGMPGLYRPMSMIGSSEFLANKSSFIQNTESFVVVEPNPVILEDTLTSLSPIFDVVVVYDRMRQSNDIVVGNNVAKVFVVNSNKNYDSMKSALKISAQSLIISGDSKIKDSLTIPTIDGYAESTDTAKITKFKRLASHNGELLIETILNKSRLDLD